MPTDNIMRMSQGDLRRIIEREIGIQIVTQIVEKQRPSSDTLNQLIEQTINTLSPPTLVQTQLPDSTRL